MYILINMGGGGEQKINQAFDMSAINQSIYEQTTINKNTSLASQTNLQSMDVQLRNVIGCDATFIQNINAEASSSSTLENEQTTAIKNAITTEMTAAVQAQIEKATEAGNFQFGDKQNVSQEVTLEIQNIIENSVITENINEAIAEQVSIQDKLITIDGMDCREGGGINFEQDITAQVVADVVTTNLTDAIASSDLMNQLSAAADASQKSENTGLADIIGTFFEGLTGPMKYAMIACVVCCCMIVVLLVVMGLSPAGQSATKNLGAAGASRLGRRF
jgi:hypothetical protein